MSTDEDALRGTIVGHLRHFREIGQPIDAKVLRLLDQLVTQDPSREFLDWASAALEPTPAPQDFRVAIAKAFLAGKPIDPDTLQGERWDIANRFYTEIRQFDDERIGAQPAYETARLYAVYRERTQQYLARIKRGQGRPVTKQSALLSDLLTFLLVWWRRLGQSPRLPGKDYIDDGKSTAFLDFVSGALDAAEKSLVALYQRAPQQLASPDRLASEVRRLRNSRKALVKRLQEVRATYP